MPDSATATPSSKPLAPAVAAPRQDIVGSVAESFRDLQRTVRRSKARLLAAASNDVESATQMLLHTVAADGPMRTSALAVSAQADLSTVSRQVGVLVSRGLLERQADQLDGRASLLAVTDAGRAALAEHEQRRQAFFDEVLTGWTTEEMGEFARQLERFTVAYDQIHAARVSSRAGRQEASSPATQPHDPADLEGPNA